MKLAEMTVDEAIAVACREVAECCPPPVEVSVDFKERTIGPEDRLYRALWFDAAWEWLKLNSGSPFWDIMPMHGAWGVYSSGSHHVGDPALYPTKYHALAAAVLLAAGKEIP